MSKIDWPAHRQRTPTSDRPLSPNSEVALAQALDQLAAVDGHGLTGRVAWWAAVAIADLEHLLEVGRGGTGDRCVEDVLVDADDRLAAVEHHAADARLRERVREARQFLVAVANGGEPA